jgi:uncharacterized protein (TIGR02001 family)
MSFIRKSAVALALSAGIAAPALAQDAAPPSDWTLTGNVAVVSDYRFRGVSLSDQDPALQGGLNLNHSSGFYGGVWASSLAGFGSFGGWDTEIDTFVGWTGDVGGAVFDIGGLYYHYPDTDGTSYGELYASIAPTLGPVTTEFGIWYAPDQSNTAGDNVYVYTDISAGIPDTPITLKGHLGYQDGAVTFTGKALDWMVGADVKYGPVVLGVQYIDTDISQRRAVREAGIGNGIADSAVVVSLTANF